MDEKKFVSFKKDELRVREYIKNSLGKGKISAVTIEYTPVGEKINVFTSRPGLVIGRRGEKIDELTTVLKRNFKLDNPHIEINEITQPLLDAQLVADEIALLLERRGPLKFKVIAYNMLQQIMKSGARGTEIVLSGKLPSERAKRWRFSQGYLKKTGDPVKAVDYAQSQATTIPGVVGVQVSILRHNVGYDDQIHVNPEMLQKINLIEEVEEIVAPIETKKKKTRSKKQ